MVGKKKVVTKEEVAESGSGERPIEVPEKLFAYVKEHPNLYPGGTWHGHQIVVRKEKKDEGK